MKIGFLVAAVILGALFNCRSLADDAPSPGALLQQRLDALSKLHQVQAEQQPVISEISRQMWDATQLAKVLTTRPSEDELQSLQTSKQNIEANIRGAQIALEAVNRELEMAQIQDPEIRAQKAKEWADRRAALNRQFNDAARAMTAKVNEFAKPLEPSNAAMCAALSRFLRDGTGKYASQAQPLTWNDAQMMGQMQWTVHDKSQPDAITLIMLQEKQGDGGKAGDPRIDGKYPMTALGGGRDNAVIDVYVGYFKLQINIKNKDWLGDNPALMEMVKNLVDLDALAAWTPEPAK